MIIESSSAIHSGEDDTKINVHRTTPIYPCFILPVVYKINMYIWIAIARKVGQSTNDDSI
jgi:hypothetical protein